MHSFNQVLAAGHLILLWVQLVETVGSAITYLCFRPATTTSSKILLPWSGTFPMLGATVSLGSIWDDGSETKASECPPESVPGLTFQNILRTTQVSHPFDMHVGLCRWTQHLWCSVALLEGAHGRVECDDIWLQFSSWPEIKLPYTRHFLALTCFASRNVQSVQ